MLKRIDVFTRLLEDGRICLINNAAERVLRGIALGRKSWLFAGSDRGGVRAAIMLTLIHTAKLNDVDPQAWLADVLGRIAVTRLATCRGIGAPPFLSIAPLEKWAPEKWAASEPADPLLPRPTTDAFGRPRS